MSEPDQDKVASETKPRRRVVVPPPKGTDPRPVSEPERHQETENDDRLKADKPPHYYVVFVAFLDSFFLGLDSFLAGVDLDSARESVR